MGYIKCSGESTAKNRHPYLISNPKSEGGSANYTGIAKTGDLIVWCGYYMPTAGAGLELIDSWRNSSDISGKNSGLYRVISDSNITFSWSSHGNPTLFSSLIKKNLEYEFIYMPGSQQYSPAFSVKRGDIIVYPQRNTGLGVNRSVARMRTYENYTNDMWRCYQDDDAVQVLTTSGVGLRAVHIY